MISPSLRKAAVLISALEERAADAILNELGAEEAARVRRAVFELDEITSAEQQQVLAEFFSQRGAPAPAASEDDGVELDINFSAEPPPNAPVEPKVELPPSGPRESLFGFLETIDPPALAALLGREQIQTLAAIVSQLSPSQAAAVLESLPPGVATDCLERMASLIDLAPEVQRDLAEELRRQLAPHLHAAAAGPASLARLSAVLNAMGQNQRQRVVGQLAQQNAALLRRAGLIPNHESAVTAASDSVVSFRYRLASDTKPSERKLVHQPSKGTTGTWLEFDDLAQLDDASLRAVFATCAPEVALIALTGADSFFVNRILRHFSPEQATVLRNRLDHPGPIRLRDIEEARQKLAAAAGQLARDGEIALPPRVRFAAAV